MTSIIGDSSQDATPAISGRHTSAGRAVEGISLNGPGVHGESTGFVGIWGKSQSLEGIVAETTSPNCAALAAYSRGIGGTGAAIFGRSENKGAGVYGISGDSFGVIAESTKSIGLLGKSAQCEGVVAESTSPTFAALAAFSKGQGGTGAAIFAKAENKGIGVIGLSEVNHGVFGESKTGIGIWGKSAGAEGVVAESFSQSGSAAFAAYSKGRGAIGAAIYGLAENNGAGIVAITRGTGPAIIGKAEGNAAAAVFQRGDVVIESGNLRVLTGDIILQSADCAEEFDISSSRITEPGTVMVITSSGDLTPCEKAYDKRVAGVISGAGTYKPAMILDRQPEATTHRMPVALVGKVFCKVDAQFGAIEVGDLLTSSSTLGHAQKASDFGRTNGALIGKALAPHRDGQGLIPILVALQ